MKYQKINTLFKRTSKEEGSVIRPGNYSQIEFTNMKYWLVSEKIDGMNMRVIYTKDGVEFRGRTDKAQIPGELLNVMTKIFTEEKMASLFDLKIADTIILYGEGYGKGIQKGGAYRDDQAFILFDIMIDGVWFASEKVTDYAKLLGIERVPIFGLYTITEIIGVVKTKPAQESLVGKSGTIIEGIVARSDPLMLDRMGKRVCFKLKVKDYEKLERYIAMPKVEK
jgi:ATP-dependent RNA circularization protein (DNA/RNA ligase family)